MKYTRGKVPVSYFQLFSTIFENIMLAKKNILQLLLHLKSIRNGSFLWHSPGILNLGSIKPQGFGESVSGVRLQEILSKKSKNKKKFTTHVLFFQLWMVWLMHVWNLWGSASLTRLRTIGIVTSWISIQIAYHAL